MNHDFKIGDIVRPELGGPDMTVLSIEPDYVYVAYDEEGTRRYGRFFHKAVMLVTPVNAAPAADDSAAVSKAKRTKS